MHILIIGLNHKTAPVELRERVSISDLDLDIVLSELQHTRTVLESVVLSTCNRTEIYAVVNSSMHAGEDFLRVYLARHSGLSRAELDPYLYVHRGDHAVTHLMEVAAGLDSMVIGESQILGQVRAAFFMAADAGNTGALFNQLFRTAIQLGKRAQTETKIGQSATSVSYAAVEMVKKAAENPGQLRALVVGAGKMGRLTAQYLNVLGISEIQVVNRTLSKAQEVASEVGGRALAWTKLPEALEAADVVISSTGSSGVVLSAKMLRRAMGRRVQRRMLVIDIAVPRDVEPEAASVKGIQLYDIDDLQEVIAANLAERTKQAALVREMIREALSGYSKWLAEQEVVPLIAAIRAKGVQIQANVMKSLERKLPELSERELQLIHKHTMSIVNQLLHDPVQNMKELAIASGGAAHVCVFAQLFGITEENFAEFAKTGLLAAPTASDASHASHAQTGGDVPGFAELVRQWSEALYLGREAKRVPRVLQSAAR